ncbi:MAG: hypothetical protein N2Z85_02905 [Patescibacteria group bacterium]|nr:hypothetical protein [Patescibacteria group bacterium]
MKVFCEYNLSKNVKILNTKDFNYEKLNNGDIVVILDGEGRIIKVKDFKNDIFEDASMEEAFENLNESYVYTINPKDIKSEKYYTKGVYLDKHDNEFKVLFKNFEIIDYDSNLQTTDDKIVIDGFLNINLDGKWKISIEKNSINELEFYNNLKQNSRFEITFSTPIRVPLPFSREITISEYEFQPVIVGPIVFTPTLSIVAGFNIGVAGTIKLNLSNSINAFYNITFKNGRWESNGNLDEKEFGGNIDFIGADGWIKGYIGPRMKLKFYDIVGPYTELVGFLKTETKTVNLTPFLFKWGLYGGADINAGISVKIFSLGMNDFEKKIFSYESEIVSGFFPKKEKSFQVIFKSFELKNTDKFRNILWQ